VSERDLPTGRRLGQVVSGALSKGLTVRLEGGVSVEEMAVGRYVVIHGQRRTFFGMITDVRLELAHPHLGVAPPDLSDPFIAAVVQGTSLYATLEVLPLLVLSETGAPQPVKTVPSHFAPVAEATEGDVQRVFGPEDIHHFYIGQPLDMNVRVCLNLPRLVERSSGVFGKSGTGKTFLTRLLLIGLVQKSPAVTLVFDMHNEYGWAGTSEDHGRPVKGLKQLFGARVAIFSLDPSSTRARGASPDYTVEIGYHEITADDIDLLQDALGLSPAAVETVRRLARHYGDDRWFEAFLATTPEERADLAKSQGLNPGTLDVLHRKLENRLQRLPFLKPRVTESAVQRILEYLLKGIHVVLEFGRHHSLDAYLLVANILTRRIHERYVDLTERAMGERNAEPRPLVIVIEEAHKFLNPRVADLTTFGTIAREMRKYNVTLLVVDQRPSSIADEVMSQIGTRITCLLDDEKDITAVLAGIPNGQALRNVLARLETKRQALILGHAVPMPVVIRTREYGSEQSYREIMAATPGQRDGRHSLEFLQRLADP
jgi:DNA helicase HerA-like ATPase